MSAVGPLQPALLASAYRSADDTVLVSMPLKDGADRNRLSRFGEDVWDMDPAIFHMTARNAFRAIDFGCIASPIERLTAKEYIFAWLNERLPDGAARLRPLSTRAALATLRRFMAFVRDQLGTFDAAAIDQGLLDAYLALQKDRMVLPSRVASCLKPAAELRRLAPFLTCGGLTFVPWNGRSIFSVAGCRGRTYENVTPRIPEPVIGALLHWSLKYIDVFSVDIFAARAELDALEQRYAIRPRHAGKGSVVTKMMAWIEQRRQAGRGVPVWNAPSSIGGLCDAIVRSGTPEWRRSQHPAHCSPERSPHHEHDPERGGVREPAGGGRNIGRRAGRHGYSHFDRPRHRSAMARAVRRLRARA